MKKLSRDALQKQLLGLKILCRRVSFVYFIHIAEGSFEKVGGVYPSMVMKEIWPRSYR